MQYFVIGCGRIPHGTNTSTDLRLRLYCKSEFGGLVFPSCTPPVAGNKRARHEPSRNLTRSVFRVGGLAIDKGASLLCVAQSRVRLDQISQDDGSLSFSACRSSNKGQPRRRHCDYTIHIQSCAVHKCEGRESALADGSSLILSRGDSHEGP